MLRAWLIVSQPQPLPFVKTSICETSNRRRHRDHLIIDSMKTRTVYALFIPTWPMYIFNNLSSCWINLLNKSFLSKPDLTWGLCVETESRVFISGKAEASGVWDELGPILFLLLTKFIPPCHISTWTKQKRQRGRSPGPMALRREYLLPCRNPQPSHLLF